MEYQNENEGDSLLGLAKGYERFLDALQGGFLKGGQ